MRWTPHPHHTDALLLKVTPQESPGSRLSVFSSLRVIHSDILSLKNTARGRRSKGRSTTINLIRKRPANGKVKQHKVRVMDGLRPGRRGDVGGDDLPEEHAVDEPADGLERLRAVDFERVGVEVALTGRAGALPAAGEAVGLGAGAAGVGAAVEGAP